MTELTIEDKITHRVWVEQYESPYLLDRRLKSLLHATSIKLTHKHRVY